VLQNIRISGLTLRYPIIEDPREIGRLGEPLQFSRYSPDARAARAAVVADGVHNLRLEGLEVQWPDGTLDPDWGDDIDTGMWSRPHRSALVERLSDPPPFHAVWLRRCEGGLVDVGGVAPSQPGLPAVDQDVSPVTIRR
jgi:hypothetical protein